MVKTNILRKEVFMAERLTRGYEELEMEAIEESTARFAMEKEQRSEFIEDPRFAATEANAAAAGFALTEGQYVDLLKSS